jgi:hypothetical protein
VSRCVDDGVLLGVGVENLGGGRDGHSAAALFLAGISEAGE